MVGDHLPPRLVWENVRGQIVTSPKGFVIFDDMVLDKGHSGKIELVRQQWSGNAKQVIRGIRVVTCVYVNPETDQFWIIDYRIFAPETDHKSKLDHMREMLSNAVHHKQLPFGVVLMDTWYATKDEMLFIERLGKIYYCPLKENRLASLNRQDKRYQRVDRLLWSQDELRTGWLVHLRDFPSGHQVKLFRLALSTGRTDCPQSHQLYHAGMGAPETSRLRNRSNDLSSQVWSVVRLSAPTTSFTVHSDGPA